MSQANNNSAQLMQPIASAPSRYFIPVTNRTKAHKGGRVIQCPKCSRLSVIGHFRFVSLGCLHCGAMISKQELFTEDRNAFSRSAYGRNYKESGYELNSFAIGQIHRILAESSIETGKPYKLQQPAEKWLELLELNRAELYPYVCALHPNQLLMNKEHKYIFDVVVGVN